jgi:hypothetical protein
MPFNSDYRAQLASYDAHWAWKLGLRVLLILVDITAIGLIAWATASAFRQGNEGEDIWDSDVIPWALIPVRLPHARKLELY